MSNIIGVSQRDRSVEASVALGVDDSSRSLKSTLVNIDNGDLDIQATQGMRQVIAD